MGMEAMTGIKISLPGTGQDSIVNALLSGMQDLWNIGDGCMSSLRFVQSIETHVGRTTTTRFGCILERGAFSSVA